jgi:hypothetical protein
MVEHLVFIKNIHSNYEQYQSSRYFGIAPETFHGSDDFADIQTGNGKHPGNDSNDQSRISNGLMEQ